MKGKYLDGEERERKGEEDRWRAERGGADNTERRKENLEISFNAYSFL